MDYKINCKLNNHKSSYRTNRLNIPFYWRLFWFRSSRNSNLHFSNYNYPKNLLYHPLRLTCLMKQLLKWRIFFELTVIFEFNAKALSTY